MATLSNKEIQFIDTYLQNNQVVYVDIRSEMIDHIASAIEVRMEQNDMDFYNNFKEYMVVNKNEILKNNPTKTNISWAVLKKFGTFIVQPKMLLLGVLLFFIFKNTLPNVHDIDHFSLNNLIFILFISIIVIQYAVIFWLIKKRFYAIEKSGQILMILYWLRILLAPFNPSESLSLFTISLFSFLMLTYVLFVIDEVRFFQKNQLKLFYNESI